MATALEDQKKKIEIQKKKIQLKEKLLKEKEKQRKFRRVSEIVEIAFKTSLDEVDDDVLLGAFLEISERINDPHAVQTWKKIGEAHLKNSQDKSDHLLAISFNNEPAKEIREVLKKMKFRWNPFRKEFCGYGNEKKLGQMLKEFDASMERIDE